jgi:hypothetical protein
MEMCDCPEWQPLKAHEHWHINLQGGKGHISYINICGTFYYLFSILDGFSRISGMTHVKTSPYYLQSNGNLERYHKTIKGTCIRVHTPLSLANVRTVVADFVDHYNTRRLHSAIGYVTPNDKLEGWAETILAQREAKLALARETRRAKRKAS